MEGKGILSIIISPIHTHPTITLGRCGTRVSLLFQQGRSLLVLLDVTAQVPRMESSYLPRRAGADKGRGPGVVARMEIEREDSQLLLEDFLSVR